MARQRSTLLSKYQDQLKKNPTSRVFAPLAEILRKMGLYDEALTILKNGIKFNPTYPLGYIVLAHAYYDLGNLDKAYDIAKPFTKTNLDNVYFQKLFGKICEANAYFEEALETYKYLLFINPKDEEVASKVLKLEKELFLESEYQFENYEDKGIENSDDWVQVHFDNQVVDTSFEMKNFNEPTKDIISKFREEIKNENIEIKETNLDDEYYFQDFDAEEEVVAPEVDSKPIITHTLVDLYLKQNYYDKALEFLESILKIHPSDQATIDKLNDVLLLKKNSKEGLTLVSNNNEKLKEKYMLFLAEIKKKHEKNSYY